MYGPYPRALARAAFALFTLLPLASCSSDADPAPSAVYGATHNSYSGNVDGAKGSILSQLDGGVRFIELDIHDNGYSDAHDYQIGHDGPGNAVDHANGNPASNSLRDWLVQIAGWSSVNTSHAGLTVMLDIKDDLTDNTSFAAGNLGALNGELLDAFGAQIFPADAVGATFPTIGALRGKVLCLLSGDGGTRTEYKRDVGSHPAVAINARGQVVEVHDSGHGTLWYWTGTYGADGRVTWQRHGEYDDGTTPAVTLADDGYLVEVHQSQSATTLWYHVGFLGGNGEITWGPSHQYDNGILPTVRFSDGSGASFREIHRSEAHDQNWDWRGTLNRGAWTLSFSSHGTTSDARYDAASSSSGSSRVTVYTGADGASPSNTLRYATDRVADERLRYYQRAFVEFQDGDGTELQSGAWYYGAPATHSSFIIAARNAGRLVRGWDFDSSGLATSPLANYPATNYPHADWYEPLIVNNGGAD